MRFRLRRTVLYVLFGVILFIFIGSLQHNSFRLAVLENGMVADDLSEESSRDPDDKDIDVILENSQFENHVDKRIVVPEQQSTRYGIWEPGEDKWNDRIQNQINFVPKSYNENTSAMKYIFVPSGLPDTPPGRRKFIDDGCLVNKCYITSHAQYAKSADAVLVQNTVDALDYEKRPGQIWILWLLESPHNTISLNWLHGDKKVNWTASYRADSTIVSPYEKFVHFSNFTSLPDKPLRNYADGKTKMVAWFVSNCGAMNKRLEYAKMLQKHLDVDIYGGCGPLRCARGRVGNKCDKILSADYKFYLSFENSNCQYYITEKLFWNALLNDIVPVVMGARTSDYLHAAPPNSYIHVEDFASAQDLANYLLKLDQNDDLYDQYFRWKRTGEFLNTKFWCRMCAMLHDVNKPSLWVDDVEEWWRNNGTCTKNRWDVPDDVISEWQNFEQTI